MPNRIIRDSILYSEKVCSLGWPEEVLFRRLMSIVDDYGRHEAHPQLLRSKCYPMQTDSVRVADITRWLAACQKAGVIVLYEVSGKSYLQIENFGQQQRSASKCPAPDAADSACKQLLANEHLGVSVFVSEGVSVSEGVCVAAAPQKPSRKAKKTSIPNDFVLSDRVRAWAAAKGHDRLEQHFESFVSRARSKGYEYADWDEALMGAIRDNWAKLPVAAPTRHSGFDLVDYSAGVNPDGTF